MKTGLRMMVTLDDKKVEVGGWNEEKPCIG